MTRAATLALVAIAALASCRNGDGKATEQTVPSDRAAPAEQTPAPSKDDERDPVPDGAEIEVTGKAENAMEGAVVVTDSGAVYFVEGVTAWDDATLDRRVVVKGVVVRKKLAPDPEVGIGGTVTHGAHGRSKVLTKSTWRLE